MPFDPRVHEPGHDYARLAGCAQGRQPLPRHAGTGFALLEPFARTGDEVWPTRARRFAVHAAAQVEAERRRRQAAPGRA